MASLLLIWGISSTGQVCAGQGLRAPLAEVTGIAGVGDKDQTTQTPSLHTQLQEAESRALDTCNSK